MMPPRLREAAVRTVAYVGSHCRNTMALDACNLKKLQAQGSSCVFRDDP